ncbi:MAG: GIY-YIG nuclease family protein [Gammaproteobacteria bacterium]|nr:GIY-YIG nuclease family protein [Gammaproteobacteria bacterium]
MTELSAQNQSNEELLQTLGVEIRTKKNVDLTPEQERVIAGFEEIQRFVNEYGRLPCHGEDREIFERLYAVRLECLIAKAEHCDLLRYNDHQDLLSSKNQVTEPVERYNSNAEILAELGVEATLASDITHLKHVKPRSEVRTVEEIARRKPCHDFETFQSIFKQLKIELEQGVRKTQRFGKDASINVGNYFIIDGLTAYVAEVGETIKAPNGDNDARTRVIFSNGTESNLLMRSLQRALYKDETGRRIGEKGYGPLFDDRVEENDLASGTIYVLRSLSNHPTISQNRDVIHKIGVTSSSVEKRLGNAENEPTYLMAAVEVVATYELYNINRIRLENLLHRFFKSAKLDIEIMDRFGKPVIPQEWFLVPIFVIDEVVDKIKDCTIADYVYDAENAILLKK